MVGIVGLVNVSFMGDVHAFSFTEKIAFSLNKIALYSIVKVIPLLYCKCHATAPCSVTMVEVGFMFKPKISTSVLDI